MKFNKLIDLDTFCWKRIQGADLEGIFDMPRLEPVHGIKPENLTPFHMAKTSAEQSVKWFHFYEDDYQFERVWNKPVKYLSLLKKFAGGIGTDFSIYVDMPRAQQIWNCWRNRVMTYYFQKNGIITIPNVGWSDSESLEWAFDGLPENSTLAITTQGCMGKNYVLKQQLLNGIHELARRKNPELLIVYGKFPKEWINRFPMQILVFKTFAESRWEEING